MTPSWYDVLDVEPTASAEEVRTAWRASVADLDPTDRRFRLLNQAAEVLLDTTRRAEHDAALAADADAAREGDEEDAAPESAGLGTTGHESTRVVLAKSEASSPDDEGAVLTLATPEVGAGSTSATPATTTTGWVAPWWLIAGTAVLAAVAVVLAVLVFRSPSDQDIASSAAQAQATAERAAEAVLAYDYRDMDSSKAAAEAYLTPTYRQQYDQLFQGIIDTNAVSLKTVVTTDVVASGIARVSPSGDRVSVLVFVNRPILNAQLTTPKISQDQVTMKMVRSDGQWLVDDMVATPVGD